MDSPDILSALKQAGRLAPAELARISRLVAEESRHPEAVLIELGLLPEEELAYFLCEVHGLPFRRLGQVRVPLKAVNLLGLERLQRDLIVPVELRDGGLVLAVAAPGRAPALAPLIEYFQCPVSLAVSTPSDIRTVLGRLRDGRPAGSPGEPADTNATVGARTAPALGAAPVSDTELLRMLGQLLFEAAANRVSNVHVNQGPEGFGLRLRRDGILEDRGLPLLPVDQQRLFELLRRLAGLDPRDRKGPRSGQFRLPVTDREGLNLRVSFAPTLAGERLAIRLLETPGRRLSLEELGFGGQALLRIRSMLLEPSGGLVLVAGPGGSGRSATLAAMLAELPEERALFSVENPVEQRLPGVQQLEVDTTLPGEEGSPAALLAAALAQDADAVMVSRLSEPRTVEQAVSAAFGGCLVLGAVTAADGLSALRLLLELGAEPFMLGSALRGVVAQRLVRTLCTSCRRAVYRMPEELVRIKNRLGLAGSTIFEPAGCARCGYRGWAGRTALHEVLVPTPELAEALQDGCAGLRRHRSAGGHRGLLVSGTSLVLAGQTTIDEVQRALGALAPSVLPPEA